MHNRLHHRQGLTLVELMVCVAMLAVLLTLAVPSMQGFLARRRLEGLSAQFIADLQFARSAAVARGELLRLRVHATSDGSTCYLVHSGAANTCTCQVDQTVLCSGSAQALRVVQFPVSERSSVRANVPGLPIDPRQGTVSPAGSIDISVSDGSTLRHVVNIMGRVRLCTPPGVRVGDVPTC
jgi:type IV fimbrial biogenesis protein FimT